jgi:hypothetical protein
MNSMGADCARDVNAIVDYQLHATLLGNSDCSFGCFIEFHLRQMLLAELNERSTTERQQLNLFCVRKTG